jgi:hypothetical protein
MPCVSETTCIFINRLNDRLTWLTERQKYRMACRQVGWLNDWLAGPSTDSMQIITEAAWTPFCAHELLVRSALVKAFTVTSPSSLQPELHVLIKMGNTHYNLALGQLPDTRFYATLCYAMLWCCQYAVPPKDSDKYNSPERTCLKFQN